LSCFEEALSRARQGNLDALILAGARWGKPKDRYILAALVDSVFIRLQKAKSLECGKKKHGIECGNSFAHSGRRTYLMDISDVPR